MLRRTVGSCIEYACKVLSREVSLSFFLFFGILGNGPVRYGAPFVDDTRKRKMKRWESFCEGVGDVWLVYAVRTWARAADGERLEMKHVLSGVEIGI